MRILPISLLQSTVYFLFESLPVGLGVNDVARSPSTCDNEALLRLVPVLLYDCVAVFDKPTYCLDR